MKKICTHCGKEFETNNPQKIYCSRQHYRPCPVCGKPTPMLPNNDFSRPPRCCSYECRHKQRIKSFPERICAICGQPFTPRTGPQICCDKVHYRPCVICGNPIIQKSPEDPVVTCSKECTLENRRRKNIQKYGVPHPMMLPEVKQKFKDSMKQKYGVEHALQNKELVKKSQSTNLIRYGMKYACNLPQCMSSPYNSSTISKLNEKFCQHLEIAGIRYTKEFPVENRAFDIAIPDQKILIEINPTYTHTYLPNVTHYHNPGLDRNYHRDKSILASKYGYRCIHVFDWDDWDKIINLIRPKIKIRARDCSILKLYELTTKKFLNAYDIKGDCSGKVICLGLVKGGVLYETMVFGRGRWGSPYDAEILRLCTIPGVQVLGGASKLFNFFMNTYELSSVVSYCDNAKFDGGVYNHLNMTKIRDIAPQAYWTKGTKRVTSNYLSRNGYSKVLGVPQEDNLEDTKAMVEHGWLPIYDCGQSVYAYDISKL